MSEPSESSSPLQEVLLEVMDVLFEHRHEFSDVNFVDMSNALRVAYEMSEMSVPAPESPPEAERIHVQLHVPDVGKLDLGAFPFYEDTSRFSPRRPPRGFRRLPATKPGVDETWAVLESSEFMLETRAYGLLENKMLVGKKPSGFDNDARRFNTYCHISQACEYFEDGSVYLQLTGPGLSEYNHNLPLQVLDAEKMLFYVRGFGSYCMVLSLLPSPALVLLHNREDEMMVEDPSSMLFRMAMVAWRGDYWSGGEVNGC